MTTSPTSSRHAHRAAGFTLIELMVGLLIGMLAIIVMLQVYASSEGYKRTTTGGNDAQTNGALALYELQRGIQQGGLGISALSAFGCSVQMPGGWTLAALAPVTINSASLPAAARDANTDTLIVVYGNANGSGEGELVQAQPGANIYTVKAAVAGANSPGPFASGDQVIAVPNGASPCNATMSKVTVVEGAGGNVTLAAATSGMNNGTLYNLGARPTILAYAVQQGNLTVCDYTSYDCGSAAYVGDANVWVPIASNIVSLRAEYGKDTSTPMDGTVDSYDQGAPAVACQWSRVSAMRLAVVARSAQYEKNDQNLATAAPPTWASSTTPIVLSAFTDWQHYRYKVLQAAVPLRNIVWLAASTVAQGAPAGC